MNFFRKILAGAVVAASLFVTPSAGAVIGDCLPGSDWGTPRQDLSARVVTLVNQHRASKGLVQLQATTTLTNSGLWKSRHMARYAYMTHNDPAPPVARNVADRLLACGYPSDRYGWGENIAAGYGTPEAVMQAWLNSTGHRANIEKPGFRAIGVGAAASSTGRIYWTQQFGTLVQTATPSPSPSPTASPTPAPTPTTLTAVPSSTSVSTGTVRAGSYANLRADDNSYFQVNSSNSATTWYGRMTAVPNSVTSLAATYRGMNSVACNQTIGVWNWTRGVWVWLDTRSVGAAEATITVIPTGTLAEYVSGSTGNGDVAVMVRCSAGSAFYVSADQMKIDYRV